MSERRGGRAAAGAVLLCVVMRAHADAGPPFLANDPGTPGPAHWEINTGWVPTGAAGVRSDSLPQLDVNWGVGERVQLTLEAPYQRADMLGSHAGWGNVILGGKWRFLDQGEQGWQASVFPQWQFGVSSAAQQRGLGVAGPRLLLPLELGRMLGPVQCNLEAGAFLPLHGVQEAIAGVVAGRDVGRAWNLDVELYEDRVRAAPGRLAGTLTADIGGRWRLGAHVIALFMAGHSVAALSNAPAAYTGYAGVQWLVD